MFGKEFEIKDGVLVDGKKAKGKVKIPNNVTRIGKKAFAINKHIKSVVIPEGVTTIEDIAFFRCEALESITLPASLTTIGKDVFYDCISLREVLIAGENKTFKAVSGNIYSFDKKTLLFYLKNDCDVFKVPKGVEKIAPYAAYRAKFSEVILPDELTVIDKNAFMHCSNLKKINLDKVEVINDMAFFGCSSMEELTLPDVKKLGEGVFSNCELLNLRVLPDSKKFKIDNGILYYYANDTALNNDSDEKLSLVSGGADKKPTVKILYLYLGNGSISLEIPGDVTAISSDAFTMNCEIEKIVIPESVKSIGESAFFHCKKLNKVILPEGLQCIENKTFLNCADLKDINIPSTVKIIGERAFSLAGFEELIIPDGVETIKKEAFFDCNLLNKVIIPESVKVIESNAFSCVKTNLKATVYCRAKIKPAGWSDDWGRVRVVWGYKGD